MGCFSSCCDANNQAQEPSDLITYEYDLQGI